MSSQPYDFQTAKAEQTKARAEQRTSEQWVINCWKAYAAAEKAYREALSKRIVELKAAGNAITACGDIARGEPAIATLKYKRDVAEGMREAAGQGSWRASADRKAEQSFLDWSMKRDLAEGYGRTLEPDDMPTYGGRRAA